MEIYRSGLRPSALTSITVPALVAAGSTQVCTLGQSAVEIQVRTAPSFLLHAGAGASLKINNYKGTTSAMGEGMSASNLYGLNVSAARVQSTQDDKVKGGDARGIPPRGRPV